MATHLNVIPIGKVWQSDTSAMIPLYRHLVKEFEAEGGQVAWCAARGLALPAGVESRLATPLEVDGVLRQLAGLRCEIKPGWVTVFTYLDNDEGTYLASYGWAGQPDEAWPFFFQSGSDTLKRFIVAHLSEVCGPLLVWDHTDSPPELLTPETPTPPYWTMPGHGGLRLVRWRHPLPQYQQRETRLLSFAAHETDFDQDYEGMPAFLAAHGIPFGEPPRETFRWTDETLKAALEVTCGDAVQFYADQCRDLIARVRTAAAGGAEVVIFFHGYPDPLMFEPGDVLGQLWVAERLARLHGPHVLLPNYLSEVPILIQAGDDPARLLAEWEKRTAALAT